ncbi:MAG: glucose-1-phosphate cytidylyltransferase [Candidatus Eisenbacteria bacterium]|uniref:Glucose-1-phosphate cytidylyltransferase n=1 Tax=Eiseniibacteriota bacterium TaxID=2212470 RepID=A0A849SJG4_UNCEI|nr:glucose-1-phosphate cytidylyltransferase [Candidatus Eisenbacteria bacterium]
MQTVILAGGLGTRLSEETSLRPKPMVEIGDRPILHHIMDLYASQGFDEFVVALGYLGHMIKRYVVDWTTLSGDLAVDLKTGGVVRHESTPRHWKVNLVETGAATETGGRLKRCTSHLRREPFMLTYGDGVCDVDLRALVAFHRAHGKLATVTAVHPPARFGELDLNGDRVEAFAEKRQLKQGWINGGFMVLEPRVLDIITGDDTVLERDVLEVLAGQGELCAFRHEGFWQCMDTLRDVRTLSDMWQTGKAPWRRA